MKINTKKTVILFLIYLVIVFSGAIFVHGSSTDKISGWAWSDNIGWISLNCTNTSCASSNYGVTVNLTTGNFSGYAWSDNLGWINFAPSGPYPDTPNNSANYNSSTNKVTGWVQVVSNNDWIKLGDTNGKWKSTLNTQVKINTSTKEFEGWAWSDNLGWISFNCFDTDSCQ